ncbi:hypothetical protein NA78x_005577 [Anatilimnocola sp. NA78]|uniref:hypothetical protein n=1 Tax=Anatilimnocola sp. NA78 TaxID=3415683 RepID=UPI003CE591BA
MGLKTNVIETLASSPVRWINFSFANRLVSPIGYYYIGSLVSNNTIKCEVDAALGHTAMYDVTNNKIIASDGSYGERYFDEKSLLIHECTHALLDHFYSGRDMNGKAAAAITVLEDETIAYIAQAIYVVAAKGATPTDETKADTHAYNAVKEKILAMMKKGWTGCDTLVLTNQDVKDLQSSIKLNPNYSKTYSSAAVHDG